MKKISASELATHDQFYKLPKSLFKLNRYKEMKLEAKVFYSFLMDRFNLSLQNNWIDEDGYVYFVFSVEELMALSGFGKNKVIRLKQELQSYDLLTEVRKGQGKANWLYLGAIEASDNDEENKNKKFKNETSRSLDLKPLEASKSNPNKTDISKTEYKDIYSSRKASSDSNESGIPTKADLYNFSTYVGGNHYSALTLIENEYFNSQPWYSAYHLTHKQKMLIGQHLESGYITVDEILVLIHKMPQTESPFAYLMRMIENLCEERRLEQKLMAHSRAVSYYPS